MKSSLMSLRAVISYLLQYHCIIAAANSMFLINAYEYQTARNKYLLIKVVWQQGPSQKNG